MSTSLAIIRADDQEPGLLPEQYNDPRNYIVLHPVVQVPDEARDPDLVGSWAMVQISTAPESGDTFDAWWSRGKKALSRHGLLKISSAAGFAWADTVFDGPHVDPVTRHRRITATARASVRQPNGENYSIPGTVTIDTELIEDERIVSLMGRDKKLTRDQAVAKVAAEIRQVKKHLTQIAESKAMNRVIRAVMDLPQDFDPRQLDACPFVIPRALRRPGSGEDETARALTDGAQAVEELYGQNSDEGKPAFGEGADGFSSDDAGEEGGSEAGAVPDGQPLDVEPSSPKRPAHDPKLSAGPYQSKPVSFIAEKDPDWLAAIAREERAATPGLVAVSREWLAYFHPETFGPEAEAEPW